MKKFLHHLFPFRFRSEISEHHLLRGTPMEERLNTSAAPWIITIVLVWIASSVLLILTARHAAQAGGMTIGSTALRDFRAVASFEYNDRKKNEKLRRELLENVPIFCRIMPQRTNEIQRDLTDLFSCVETRAAVIKQHRQYDILKDSLSSRLTANMSAPLLEELAAIYLNNRNYEIFQRAWQTMLSEGILPVKVRSENKSAMPLRTIDSRGRLGAVRRTGDITDANLAARNLAIILFPQGGVLASEFRQVLNRILGDGNLQPDEHRRQQASAEADRSFRPSIRHILRGEVLIKNGDVVTPELMELAIAAERAIPPELHPIIYYRVALSLVLLAVTVFFIFRIYPEVVRENRLIMLTGAIVIIAMVVNYAAIKVFHSSIAVRLSNPVTPISLQLFVPAALGAILLTVTVGYRVAMCSSLLIVSTTVLMLSPDRPYELVLRYLVLAALAGLAVRKVTNYRSLFVRGFFATAMLVLILNCDLIFSRHRTLDELLQVTVVSCSNAFITAVLTQVFVFLFELVFNVSTDMSFMVLSDYNHPLLERMKREAPGTMFHSMTVATLAEDAARAIGANPLAAKACALYHDIGKLEKNHYFIENNHSSDKLHQNLAPAQSAKIILGHVAEGLRLARSHRLGAMIREAIRTHHGDSTVYFFYAKAKAESPDTPVDESLFRYGGYPPRSRELTIISLADACEAAVRSQEHPDQESIRSKVEEIFLGRLKTGQLRNSLLSLKELDKVKESFISTLISIYHGRIAYTTENINEAVAQQMEQPPSSQTGTQGS